MTKVDRKKTLEGLTIVQNILEREMLESESRGDAHFSFRIEYAPSNIGNPYPNGQELLRLKISVWNGMQHHEIWHQIIRSTLRDNCRWYRCGDYKKIGRPLK